MVIRPPPAEPEWVSARRPERYVDLRIADEQPLAASWDPQPALVSRHGRSRGSNHLDQAVATYGWRVYALPAFVIFTVLAVLDAGAPFGAGRLFTYTVEIEDGGDLEGGPAGFAATTTTSPL